MTLLQLSFNILTFLKIDKRTENSVLIADYWELVVKVINSGPKVIKLFGTRDLFNISYSRELYLFSKFLHFEEIVRVKMAVCFEMIVSET